VRVARPSSSLAVLRGRPRGDLFNAGLPAALSSDCLVGAAKFFVAGAPISGWLGRSFPDIPVAEMIVHCVLRVMENRDAPVSILLHRPGAAAPHHARAGILAASARRDRGTRAYGSGRTPKSARVMTAARGLSLLAALRAAVERTGGACDKATADRQAMILPARLHQQRSRPRVGTRQLAESPRAAHRARAGMPGVRCIAQHKLRGVGRSSRCRCGAGCAAQSTS
jgi:hypothetical protein